MNVNQLIGLMYVFAIVSRYSRLKERWTAPLMRGSEWFFSVAVPPDFIDGPGRDILRRYRLRLFIPWLIEIAILAVILIFGNVLYVPWLIVGIALFTRLNYYAARQAAENQARRFELPDAQEPVSAVALSLAPRTLASYTNRWLEAAIGISFAASFAWLGYRYAIASDPNAMRVLLGGAVIGFYLQLGLLLIKRAIINAPSVAPADNAEQYLAWRESLRRFSTWLCDFSRLLMLPSLLVLDMLPLIKSKPGSGTLAPILIGLFGFFLIATWYEWRRRSAHLEVARRTKPAKLPALPGVPASVVCFQPAYPLLLLRNANGYALNLASTTIKMAGLYIAGFALLWAWLLR